MSRDNSSNSDSLYHTAVGAAMGAAVAYGSVGAWWMVSRWLRWINEPARQIGWPDIDSVEGPPPVDTLSARDLHSLERDEGGCCWSPSQKTIDRQWMGAIKEHEAEKANQASPRQDQFSAGLLARLNWIRDRTVVWKYEREHKSAPRTPSSEAASLRDITRPYAPGPSTSKKVNFLAPPKVVITSPSTSSSSSSSSTEV